MPITDQFQRLPISSIIVDRDARQRRELEVESLSKSIEKLGVLQPIIVTQGLRLVAGERRLEASRKLGLLDIPVRFAEELSSSELLIIELEENIKRKDLEWKELIQAAGSIHKLYLELEPNWTMTETAEAISISVGTLSIYLRVAGEMEDPRVQAASTIREAYNVLARRSQRAMGDALEELLSEPEAQVLVEPLAGGSKPLELEKNCLPSGIAGSGLEQSIRPRLLPAAATLPPILPILSQSFLDWAPRYEGAKFNLIHCDFPYGIELFAGKQGRGAEPTAGYSDSKDIYIQLLRCLCQNLGKIMSVSGHLMFWYSMKHETITREIFRELAPELSFHTFPLIWIKSDNAGIASDPRHGPRHVYETCLLASKGKRQILRVVADAYSAPTDKTLHASTKPEPMLRHFMQMLVEQGTSLLDPTCGSGAALRAAESLGASKVLGLEIDPAVAGVANTALANSRKLRLASREQKHSAMGPLQAAVPLAGVGE